MLCKWFRAGGGGCRSKPLTAQLRLGLLFAASPTPTSALESVGKGQHPRPHCAVAQCKDAGHAGGSCATRVVEGGFQPWAIFIMDFLKHYPHWRCCI
jgi:hypothetical protein